MIYYQGLNVHGNIGQFHLYHTKYKMEVISRKKAIGQKLTKYYTGKTCPNGHVSERYVANYGCIDCSDIHKESFHKNNPDKKEIYAFQKAQERQEHPEKRKAYRDANTNKIKIYNKTYKDRNPDYDKIYYHNNREAVYRNRYKRLTCQQQASPPWYEKELISTLYKKRDELSELWGIQLHVDHSVPLQGKNVCGLHCWDNLQLLEASLNQSKSNKFKD